MIVKTFVISEVNEEGSETPIAVRLSFKSAFAIARLKGGRKVKKFIANKEVSLSNEEQEYIESLNK